jgi:hypothetical protein
MVVICEIANTVALTKVSITLAVWTEVCWLLGSIAARE